MRANCPQWPYVLDRELASQLGVIGWWPGAPTGGPRLFDLSGRGDHGTLSNFAFTRASGWSSGPGGPALSVDGSDDQISCGHVAALDSLSRMGFSFWCNPTSASPNLYPFLLDQWTFTGVGITVFLANSGTDVIWQLDTISTRLTTTDAPVIRDKWNHIVVTWDGATLRAYINGKLNGSTASAASYTNSSNAFVILGGSQTGAGFYKGQFSDLVAFKTCPTAAQARALFDPPTRWKLRYQPGRKVWSFVAAAGAGIASSSLIHNQAVRRANFY